ncbi:MAG: efflux RND transporter periplasmic adaptor subunit [Pseudomonadota bacterium]|nr:efflux RND transporter periplasmic adaptor subunit [Pseudomonadota bacterium]
MRFVRIAAATLVVSLAACGGGGEAGIQPRPVLVAHPDADPAGATLAYPGEVRAREEAALSFRVGGKLVRRLVDVGDRVRRGQLLAELDPGDLRLQAQAAQAQLAAAEAELARAAADKARYAQLAQQQLVSRSALQAQEATHAAAVGQARAARANFDVARNQAGYAQLRAPSDGVIALREAEAGQVVAAGQMVFGLAADGAREIVIALPEARIEDFAVGQPALVELWSAQGKPLPAHVREIAPAADPRTRTFAARVVIDDMDDTAVELGQSARVYFKPSKQRSGKAALTVPLAAVQRGEANGRAGVWVVDPETRKLHLATVVLGAYGEDRVPVFDGLEARDWIVVAGGHLLREGEPVVAVDRDNTPVFGR